MEFVQPETTQAPSNKRSKPDPKLDMLKSAFGILKTVASKSEDNDDEIGSFCKFVGNKLRSYDIRTKNMVQQALCDVLFKADSGYFTQQFHHPYQQHGYDTSPSTINSGDLPGNVNSPASSPTGSQYSTSSFDVGDYV